MPKNMRFSTTSFFWDTHLSEYRRQQIVDWANKLSENEQLMLQDMLDDACEATRFDVMESLQDS